MASENRKWSPTAEEKVRVFSWNIKPHSSVDDGMTPDKRLELQLNEILADDADVLCIQGVHHPEEFMDHLAANGYCAHYNCPTDTPRGLLMAYKQSKYGLVSKNMISYSEGWQVATILFLQQIGCGDGQFFFVGTQLEDCISDAMDDVRGRQSRELWNFLSNLAGEWGRRKNPWKPADPDVIFTEHVILAGHMTNGRGARAIQNWTDRECYKIAPVGDKGPTTYREQLDEKRKEDYIIHNGYCLSARKQTHDWDGPKLPNANFPSEHLSLCVDLLLIE